MSNKNKKQINKKTQNKKERLAILHAWKFSKLKCTDTEQCDIALKLDLLWAGGWTSRESFPPKLFQDSTALGLYMQDQLLWGQIDSIWLSVCKLACLHVETVLPCFIGEDAHVHANCATEKGQHLRICLTLTPLWSFKPYVLEGIS